MPAHCPRIYSHTCSPGFTHLGERGDRHRERKGRESTGSKNWFQGNWPIYVEQGQGRKERGMREREKKRKKEGLTCSWIRR